MTPKEKAVEFADKFLDASFTNARLSLPIHKAVAKQCALIAIQEIYELNLLAGRHEGEKDTENYYSFWEDVKSEINNL